MLLVKEETSNFPSITILIKKVFPLDTREETFLDSAQMKFRFRPFPKSRNKGFIQFLPIKLGKKFRHRGSI